MSRQIDVKNPESWDDDDRAYLRDRLDTVPAEHRHLLMEQTTPTLAPAGAAESPEIARLRAFLETNFPDEMATTEQGDTPVGVAIRLLSSDDTTDPDSLTATGDDYDTWNVADLRAEVDARRNTNPEANLPDVSKTRKPDVIAILRDYDVKYPE